MRPWSEKFESAVRVSLLTPDPALQLDSSTRLSDLRLDSLGVMSLVTQLEYSFKTTLPADMLSNGFDTTLGVLWSHCAPMEARDTA